ncbi:hypothetical protein NMG60_11031186 [Bertholletia excelsa]
MFMRGNRLSRSWRASGARVPILFTVLILVLVALILLFQRGEQEPSSPVEFVRQKWNSFESLVHLDPTVEVRNGTDVIWQIPDSPKALLFIAHGCNGRALNFWDKSPKCPECIGLPEERLIVLHALARKFAVLAISSFGDCWTFGKERMVIKGIIEWWVEKFNFGKLPIVALGASSGGYFASVLATDMRFSSITIMIAEGLFDQMDIKKDYPPTLFVHMPKDEARKPKIDANLKILKDEGVNVAEIKCMEFPLSPNLLGDRIPGLDKTISKKFYDLFRKKGFIDKNGYMKADGRALPLKAAIKESRVLTDMQLLHHIQEELNLAYAYHEMTSLQSELIFDWFESHLK